MSYTKPTIGITGGDPNGIGIEVILKALMSTSIPKNVNYVVIANADHFLAQINELGICMEPNIISQIKDMVDGAINVLHVAVPDLEHEKPGRISGTAGTAAYLYVSKAIELAMAQEIHALVTGPIHKGALYKAGYRYHGHTEILAEQTQTSNFAMSFVSPKLCVVLATAHIPLNQVIQSITSDSLFLKIKLAHELMQKLGIESPRIGIAGINPHCGEDGIFGTEENDIILPAIQKARHYLLDVDGPVPGDTLFYHHFQGKYDIVIAMYHDQALAPLKLLAFEEAVNVTLGLPFVRTSPDHGTAFDIVGKGMANPSSMIESIKMAVKLLPENMNANASA